MGTTSGMVPTVRLSNGVMMPQLGLGVWQAREGEEVEGAITAALDAGYRLIDTAAIYGNEVGVGRAIRASGLPREDMFVTSKLWNNSHDYDAALRAYDESLRRLNMDYLDLYLIHWPAPQQAKFVEAWKALEQLLADGRVRAIGVSNFKQHHLEELFLATDTIPAVNQIELHPLLQQRETRAFCAEYNIAIESYSPIMRGGELLERPELQQLAGKHNKTPVQVVLRWHIQNGFITIPKSVTPERIRENIDIFDFELSPEDMELIDGMDQGLRIGADPDTANF